MPGFIQVIPDFFKEYANRFLDYLREVPPKNRHLSVTYVPLWRKEIVNEPIGCFVPELYILAKNGQLRSQLEAPAEAPNMKTPFELAIIPTMRKNEVAKFVQSEYKYRLSQVEQNGHLIKSPFPLPTPVSKVRVVSDYLAEVTGPNGPFVLADVVHPGETPDMKKLAAKYAPNDVYITLRNPPGEMSLRERLYHWLGSLATYAIAGVAVAALVPTAMPVTLTASVAMIPLYMLGTWIVKTADKIFDMYNMAEFFNREQPWILSSFARQGRLNLRNSRDAIFKLAAIVATTGLVGMGVFASVIGLPVWGMLPASLAGLSTLVGGFCAVATMAWVYAGGIASVRYLRGLSPYDNTIKISELPAQVALPDIGLKGPKRTFPEVMHPQILHFSPFHSPDHVAAPAQAPAPAPITIAAPAPVVAAVPPVAGNTAAPAIQNTHQRGNVRRVLFQH